FSQTKKKRRCRSIREISMGVSLKDWGPVPKKTRAFCRLARLQCCGTNRQNSQPGRQHETFLWPTQRHIDSPVVEAKVRRRQRTDKLSKEKRWVAGTVNGATNSGDVADRSGGCLAVNDQNRLELMRVICA